MAEADDSIGDMITAWREESKKKFKLDRIKKMVFDSKMNKKPSEYQPEDYIPRIPEALKIKYSREQNLSSASSNNDQTLEKSSPVPRKRKSLRHSKLDVSSGDKNSKRSRSNNQIVDKENLSASKNLSGLGKLSNRYSRKALGDSNVIIETVEQNEKTPEKSSRFRSVSPNSSHEQSQLGPLNNNRHLKGSSRPQNNRSGSSELDSMIAVSASKKRGHHRSLDHFSRMISDSRQNKKPSEYDPEDFIPKSAQIAMRESALKASLREAAERKAEVERELAQLKAAAKEEEENGQRQQKEARLSRKSLHNKSGGEKKASKAKKSLNMVSDEAMSSEGQHQTTMGLRNRNHIANTSQDSTLEHTEPARKSFNKTKDIIKETQASGKKNATFEKSRQRTRIEDSSQESEEPPRRSLRTNQTVDVIKETQSQEIGHKSLRKSNRIRDSSQESLQESKILKVKDLPTLGSDSESSPTIKMIDQMRPKEVQAVKAKQPKHLVNALPITPILTARRHETAKPVLEYSYIDESLMDRAVTSNKKRKSDKYKMSSTANNSKLLQFTFNQNNSEYDTEEWPKSMKKKGKKSDRKSELLKQVLSDSPAKKAFETSLRRKSGLKDQQPQDVDQMNKAPLDLENDEVIIGSGQLYDELEIQAQQKNQFAKPSTRSKIEITKIPVKSTPILEEAESVKATPTGTASKKATRLIRSSSGVFKVTKDQTILDENDEMELAATQGHTYIKKSFAKSINSTTRSINQTNHNNTTKFQSKSAAISGARSSQFLVPDLPVRPRTVSPPLPRAPKVTAVEKTASPSPKKVTPQPIEGRDQLVYDETVASMFSDHEDGFNPPAVLPQVIEEEDEVDIAPAKTGKNLLLSGKSRGGPKKDQRKKKQPSSDSDDKNDWSSKSALKKKTKKGQETETDSDVSESNEVIEKSAKSTKKKGAKNKQESFEANKNDVSKIKKTKKTAEKSNDVAKKSVKKGLTEFDLNKVGTSEMLSKRTMSSLDKRRRTLYEINAVNEEEEIVGVRKSKRVKIDKFSEPVYEYEEVEDFDGNIIRVQHLVAVTKKDYSSKYAQYMINIDSSRKKQAKNKLIKENKLKRSQKKIEKMTEGSSEIRSNYSSESPVLNHDVSQASIHVQMNSQENTLSMSTWDQGRINETSESIIIEVEGDEMETEKEQTKKKVFSLVNQLESKKFDECYPGVSLIVLSTTEGLMCIEPQCTTKTQSHGIQTNYVMQKGSKVALSLNGCMSKHRVGDIIKVPPELQYKFKNLSHTEKAYFHFQFN